MKTAEIARTAVPPRRVLSTFVATALIGCALLATMNFLVNPLGYYPTRLVRPLTWSSRERKVELMARAPSPAALILGSSRSMKLSPRALERERGETAFNASVDSARAEDLYALFDYALDGCKWRPKDLVVGVDVEAFHDHVETDSRLVANRVLAPYLPPDVRWSNYEKMAGALLAYPQTVSSLLAMRLTLRGFPPDTIAFEPDGELTYLDARPDDRVASGDIERSFTEYDGRFAHFTALGERRTALFDAMIQRAHAEGMTTRLFLTPLHPRLLAHLRETRDFDRLRGLALAYLRGLAERTGNVTVKDFTELDAFGGDPDDFYDGAHIRSANADRVLRALWNEARADALQ